MVENVCLLEHYLKDAHASCIVVARPAILDFAQGCSPEWRAAPRPSGPTMGDSTPSGHAAFSAGLPCIMIVDDDDNG